MGPSGSDKSKLLNLISLIDRHNAGWVRMENKVININEWNKNEILTKNKIENLYVNFNEQRKKNKQKKEIQKKLDEKKENKKIKRHKKKETHNNMKHEKK